MSGGPRSSHINRARAVGRLLQRVVRPVKLCSYTLLCTLTSRKDFFHDLREIGKGPLTIADERRPVHCRPGSGLESREPFSVVSV